MLLFGVYIYKREKKGAKTMKKASVIILKIILTAAALFASYYALIIIGMFLFWNGINHIIAYI